MGHHLDTRGGSSADVSLNVVPFIDLMSCLTAFLLATAVWANVAQLPAQVGGRARDFCMHDGCDDAPKLSVLIEPDAISLAVSRIGEHQRFPHDAAGAPDWAALRASLAELKVSQLFADRTSLELAAAGTDAAPIPYQTLIGAMDVAVAVGFADVGLTDPAGLTTHPRGARW